MATDGTLSDAPISDDSIIAPPSSSTHDFKRNLSDLPDLVLERILDFLLMAKDVKDTSLTPGHKSLTRYNFSTSIMRVNKAFYTLAKPIFERNHFVLVRYFSSRSLSLSGALRDHCIWFKGGNDNYGHDHNAQRRIARFNDYHLRLEITPYTSPFVVGTAPVEFVMVCLDNLEDLVWALRMTDTVTDHMYNLKFDFKKNSNGTILKLQVQKALLQPFLKLQGRGKHYEGQTASLVGAIHPDLARGEYEKLLSPTIHWQRKRVWEMFEVMLWKKTAADRSFECGDIWSAHDQYLNFRDFYGYLAHPRHHELTSSDDVNIRRSTTRLVALSQTNFHMVCLILEEDAGFDEERSSLLQAVCADSEAIAERSYLTPNEVAVNDTLCGMASLVQGAIPRAQAYFRSAFELDPDVTAYSECLLAIDELLEEDFCPEEIASPQVAIRSVYDHLMKSLKQSNFFKPLKCTRWKARSVIKSADVERHELKRLGYTGDLFPDLIKQKKGWTVDRDTHEPINEPFNPNTVDPAIDDIIRRAAEEERTSGKKHQHTVMMPRRLPPAAPANASATAGTQGGPTANGSWADPGDFYDDEFADLEFFGLGPPVGDDDDMLDDPWLPPASDFSSFPTSLAQGIASIFAGPLPAGNAAAGLNQGGATGQILAAHNHSHPNATPQGGPAQGSNQHHQPHAPYPSFTIVGMGFGPPPAQPTTTTAPQAGMPQGPTPPENAPQGPAPPPYNQGGVVNNWPFHYNPAAQTTIPGQGPTNHTAGNSPTHFHAHTHPHNGQPHNHHSHNHDNAQPTTAHPSSSGQAATPQAGFPAGVHFHYTFPPPPNGNGNDNGQSATAAQGSHPQGGGGPGMPLPGGYAQPGMGPGPGQGGQMPLPPNCQQM